MRIAMQKGMGKVHPVSFTRKAYSFFMQKCIFFFKILENKITFSLWNFNFSFQNNLKRHLEYFESLCLVAIKTFTKQERAFIA